MFYERREVIEKPQQLSPQLPEISAGSAQLSKASDYKFKFKFKSFTRNPRCVFEESYENISIIRL